VRKAVTVVFTYKNKIFSVKRQNYLSVFPGYLAFPGGKVDKEDSSEKINKPFFDKFDGDLMHALIREVQEEVNVDLVSLPIIKMEKIAIAITPEFNPYRFETYFFWVELSEEVPFVCDEGEAAHSHWMDGVELLNKYLDGKSLAVPPTVRVLERFAAGEFNEDCKELRLPYNAATQVPWIESISGILQFLPLSHTFPPANRTNCFLIGDALIDPSPKDEDELIKLNGSLEQFSFSKILLTHHHADHHEFAPRIAKEKNIPILISQDSLDRINARWGADYFSGVKIIIINDGDILTDWKGQDVHLMSVPGHDEGQMAPYVKSADWFLAGDLFQSIGTVVVGGDEGDMAKYFSSLEKVMALKPAAIFPSHGIALGGTYKLKMTLKHRRHREEQILNLLQTGKSVVEILSEIYEGLDPKLVEYARATIEKHIEKLKEENKI
jgi:ribonuclease/clavin/mitogillin